MPLKLLWLKQKKSHYNYLVKSTQSEGGNGSIIFIMSFLEMLTIYYILQKAELNYMMYLVLKIARTVLNSA